MADRIATWLVRSKVTPPRQLLTLVERKALVERLDQGSNGSLILLEAPGGYGKSSLLTQWSNKRSEQNECVAWLSIDEDDDADTLIAYLAFSAHIAGVEVESAGLLDFEAATEKNIVQSIFKYLSCIERHPSPVHIILDDCERLSPATRDVVLPLLLRRMPENASLVLASRETLPISTVDIEHRGLVTRIGPGELRFCHQEMSELWKGRLTDRQVLRLETQTEGWPVLVRLLLAASDMGAFDIRHLEEISHSDSSITSYFEQKILARIDDDLRDFLISASIFEDITENILCDLFGVSAGSPLRQKLNALESFVVPLAGDLGGFRIHPMMREYLSHRLMAEDRGRFEALHAQAAHWYSNAGNYVRAVRHAIANGDRALILNILETTGGLQLWLREGLVEFRVIDRLLSEDIVLASPHMGMMRAIIFMKSGKQSEARQIYHEIVQRHDKELTLDPVLSLSNLACQIMISVYRGLYIPEQDIENFERQLSQSKENAEAFAGYLLTMKCVSAHQAGRFNEALRHGEDAIQAFQKDGSAYGEYYIHLHHGMIGGLMDNTKAKEKGFSKAREIIRRELSYDDIVKPLHQILNLEGEHEAAPLSLENLQRLRATVVKLLKGEGWIDIYAAACRTLSEKLYVAGGLEEAVAALQMFAEFAERNDMKYLADISEAQRALFMAAEGRVDEANSILNGMEKMARDPAQYIFEAPWRAGEVVAEAALAGGGEFGDVELWRQFRDQRLAQGNKRIGARLSAHLASLTNDRRDFSVLEATISPTLCRSLLFCADHLRAHAGNEIETLYPATSKMLAAFESEHPGRKDTTHADKAGSIFSQKEILVLHQLAQGKSDKEIALALDVTEHGIRYHLKNIYVKLGAGNRTDAVIKSQAKGVIPA